MKKIIALKSILILLITMLFAYTASAACVNLTDAGTYGTAVVLESNTFYVNEDTTLCTDTYLQSSDVTLLKVNASGITLDCNQSTLEYTSSTTPLLYGISANLTENVVIENCILEDFNGILVELSNSTILQNNNCSPPGAEFAYIQVLNSKDPIIRNHDFDTTIIVEKTTGSKIYNNQLGSPARITVDQSDDSEIYNNTIITGPSSLSAISVYNLTGAIVENNTLQDIATGIRVQYANQVTVENNNITNVGMGDDGIYLVQTSYVNITNNDIITSNPGVDATGIDMSDADYTITSGNYISGIGLSGEGIRVRGIDNVVYDNVIEHGKGNGLYIDANSEVYGNTVNNMTNDYNGVYFHNNADDVDFYDNTINNAIACIYNEETPSVMINITNNRLSNCTYGAYFDGISNHLLEGNNFTDNTAGITFTNYADLTEIINNRIIGGDVGINMTGSSNLINITSNTIETDEYGLFFSAALYNLITGNDISGDNAGIYMDTETGAVPPQYTSSCQFLNNVIHSSSCGFYLTGDTDGTVINNMTIYNSGYAGSGPCTAGFEVEPSAASVDYTATDVTFANSNPTDDAITLTFSDDVTSGISYSVGWMAIPGSLPSEQYSVGDKFLNITTLSGSPSITSVQFSWDEGELGSVNESTIALWKYDGSWEEVTASLDTGANTLTATSFTPASGYGPLGESGGAPSGPTGIPEFSTWTLIIGLMVIVGGFMAMRRQD